MTDNQFQKVSSQVMQFLSTGLILAKISDIKYPNPGTFSGHAMHIMILSDS